MTKTIIAAATALVALTAPALAEPAKRSFTRDGVTYTYVATDKGDYTVLEGQAMPSRADFRLIVRGNKVSGVSNGVPVAFRAKSKSQAGGIATAAN